MTQKEIPSVLEYFHQSVRLCVVSKARTMMNPVELVHRLASNNISHHLLFVFLRLRGNSSYWSSHDGEKGSFFWSNNVINSAVTIL